MSQRKLRLLVSVISVEEKEVDLALNSKFSDFEDALQYYTAVKNKMAILLTRNVKDYKVKDLVIQTPGIIENRPNNQFLPVDEVGYEPLTSEQSHPICRKVE